jgi:hypothetical protein
VLFTWLRPVPVIDSHREMKILLNVLLYQLVWFFCVLGGNKGAIIALSLLVIHLTMTKCRGADLKMMGFMLFLGLLVDGTLQQVGFFKFTNTGFPIPLWLMVIWLGLAITPHHSLAWLKKRPVLSAVFGAMGGPAAYWAGVQLGAASFNWPQLQALTFLGFIWAFIWTLVMFFSVISGSEVNDENTHFTEENDAE